MHAQEMIAAHPQTRGAANDSLIRCIEAGYDCAQACTACADACLGEPDVQELTQCIRLNLDCADVCAAAGAVASRRTGSNDQVVRALLDACADACRICADECERHAGRMQHCRVCAEACERCAAACDQAMSSLGGPTH